MVDDPELIELVEMEGTSTNATLAEIMTCLTYVMMTINEVTMVIIAFAHYLMFA